jgi:3-hydroxyisobutyryl-CoA hydrolase
LNLLIIGGDVKTVVANISAGNVRGALQFFEEEYKMNHLIATSKKPIVSILNGITMGGGVGISVHGHFRIITENTLIAMPETAIGLFPDVGGSFFLPRLDGFLGTFLGLTGYNLKGKEAFIAGFGTHFVPESRLPVNTLLIFRL